MMDVITHTLDIMTAYCRECLSKDEWDLANDIKITMEMTAQRMMFNMRKFLLTENLEEVTETYGGDRATKTIRIPIVPKWIRKKYAEHITYKRITIHVSTPIKKITLKRYAGYPKAKMPEYKPEFEMFTIQSSREDEQILSDFKGVSVDRPRM
jgi:hypothetical protein